MSRHAPEAPRCVLVLVPHPDDEVVGCHAALSCVRRAGTRLLAVHLTDGVPRRLWPWQQGARPRRVRRRAEEADRVAAALGLHIVHRQSLPTRELRLHLADSAALLAALVTQHEVDEVWAPAYEGGHQDHDVACWLGHQLRHRVRVLEFAEYHLAHGRITCNRFIAERGDEWRLMLDGEQRAAKQAALASYRSERGNLGYVRSECESLRPLDGYDWCHPPHPGRTFYQRFQWVPWHPRIDYTTPEEVCRSLAQATRGSR